MARINVQDTIEETEELLKAKEKLLAEIGENRTLLRGAVRKGTTTKEQKEWIEETFPEQENRTPQQRVEARRKALEDAEKKAAEAAAKGNSSKGRATAKASA